MTLLQHHILALTLTAITTFGLGLLVFLADPKRRLNQVFGLYSLAISYWGIVEGFLLGARNQASANLWAYLEWIGVIFIAPTFIHTVFMLTGYKTSRSKTILRSAYSISFLLLLLHLFTELIAAPPRPVAYAPFMNNLANIGYVIPAVFLVLVNIALWKLWHTYKENSGQRKTQLKYLFYGSLIGYLGGSPD